MKRKLVAALACRNQGTRLYGKPLQNLDVNNNVTILDNIVDCLKSIDCIEDIVLGISEGIENEIFKIIAKQKGIKYIVGDQTDVLSRLIQCGKLVDATDILRVTSESPFPYYEIIQEAWGDHVKNVVDATFLDEIVDGCGFEIISLQALSISHSKGKQKHRSELCTLYIRENASEFNILRVGLSNKLIRKDLRLTVDNPEDLVVCRHIYKQFKDKAPNISVNDIVNFLDQNEELVKLVSPYTEIGYSTMYIFDENE
ncbi:MAG: spore coat polysaccharide biosynthesis protein SpsF [Enterobacterales bacterium]|jgi:spore coat polysaccharide biosynthesis protein SpsF